jgi:hypothetical protein
MSIHANSRYEKSTVDYFRKKENGKTYPIVFYQLDDLTNISFYIHTYTTGETLEGLATRYLKSPSLWWAIAEYNPEIVDFLHLEDGTEMRIPNV